MNPPEPVEGSPDEPLEPTVEEPVEEPVGRRWPGALVAAILSTLVILAIGGYFIFGRGLVASGVFRVTGTPCPPDMQVTLELTDPDGNDVGSGSATANQVGADCVAQFSFSAASAPSYHSAMTFSRNGETGAAQGPDIPRENIESFEIVLNPPSDAGGQSPAPSGGDPAIGGSSPVTTP